MRTIIIYEKSAETSLGLNACYEAADLYHDDRVFKYTVSFDSELGKYECKHILRVSDENAMDVMRDLLNVIEKGELNQFGLFLY